jgi:hypothetical protein
MGKGKGETNEIQSDWEGIGYFERMEIFDILRRDGKQL